MGLFLLVKFFDLCRLEDSHGTAAALLAPAAPPPVLTEAAASALLAPAALPPVLARHAVCALARILTLKIAHSAEDGHVSGLPARCTGPSDEATSFQQVGRTFSMVRNPQIELCRFRAQTPAMHSNDPCHSPLPVWRPLSVVLVTCSQGLATADAPTTRPQTAPFQPLETSSFSGKLPLTPPHEI